MINKFSWRFLLSLSLLFTVFTSVMPQIGYAQNSAAQKQISGDLQSRLSEIETKLEKRRAELGIPGMSLAIVKDGEIIYLKGLGYKDFEKKISVTPDTQFGIGSATKAFTALSVLMLQDEGKLSLDDNPKKYLSYFRMYDAETDKAITIRDLLSHSSGLNRTDLAMITGKLNRAELIEVAAQSKPVAKLREKFGYQNVMFTAAGEIVATVEKQPWEKFVPERIFKPLGMNNSTMLLAEMEKSKDYSFGYDYNFDTKATRKLPLRDIKEVAPAGSINSSARDMSNWLKFVLNGGDFGGKRLVSEKSFAEWTKPQMKVAGKTSYGLGWFIQDWNGLKVVQHGGNIDGFNAMVAMIPEKNIGFVMLTNVTGSPLGGELTKMIWEGILGENKADTGNVATVSGVEKEVGKYKFEEAGIDIEVKMKDGKPVMIVPEQPVYELQNVSARKYKLVGAPDGFFITFKDDSAYLEQPQGNYTLPKAGAAKTDSANSVAAKELVGKYLTPDGKGTVEIKDTNGNVTFNIGNQPPYSLKEKSKDVFALSPLPDSYSLKVKRTADNKISSVVVNQPEGEFEFKRADLKSDEKPKITVDELMAKTIEALGGEANWRKFSTRETKFDIDFENQGVKGYGISYQKSPNVFATETTLTALNKPIGTAFEFFDGTAGGEILSFLPEEKFTGKKLEDVKVENDFYGLLNWKNGLKSAEVSGVEKVNDEYAYVVIIRPENASEYSYAISQKTFLPLKRSGVVVSSTSAQVSPSLLYLSDYRKVEGVMIPFKTVSVSPSIGDVVTYIKDVKFNTKLDDAKFKPKK